MDLIRLLTVLFFIFHSSYAKEFLVKNSTELSKLSKDLKPGDKIILTSKSYSGGITLSNIKGTENRPIIIEGKGPENTVFENGSQALHLIDCHNLILTGFTVKNFSINGINADDGGSQQNPSSGLVFKNIQVLEIGPRGNHDGFKFSGLHNFQVENCYISGWGGSAIDMVGCHDGKIISCEIVGKSGFEQSSGIQIKGGSKNIKVLKNRFNNAGMRAVNLGGSTGLQWFRPLGADYEAKEIEIAGNTFTGSMSPIAFVTSTDSHVHHNTFINPDKWVFRILQETKDPKFIKCQKGKVEANIFVFNSNMRTFVNIGPGTLPDTFEFTGNIWIDELGRRKPQLPVREKDGHYNVDLKLEKQKDGSYTVQSSKYKTYGAGGYKEK